MKKLIVSLSLALVCCSSFAWGGDYVIGDGDGLSIAVWGSPELSVDIVVRPDGKITLPAVGDVEASGLTPAELGKALTKVLGKYVKTPIVTVTVAGITNNRIYISGGGVPPRVISLQGRTSLFKLLCSLEGIGNADLMRAYIMRGGDKIEVDFHDLFDNGNLAADIDLKAEDILFLPTNELNKVYVVGAVNTPQYIIYRDGLRILDAILESGGFTKFAKESAVLILRKSGDDRQSIKINMDQLMKEGKWNQNLELKRGDYVIVKEGMF
ncbi:polysaccharide biosynthesis/export family protein [Trichloromonas sp.]|uniref:polysaccharide biosynthesis/export family protein n=1 Tax=Trichloromonas sp. TaxID=3069249 RepID=UPI003D812E0E